MGGGGGNIVKKLLWCGARSFREDVPEGRVRVYVGKDKDILCKFEVDANYLNHPLFQNLLRMSEEEFGFSYDGALRIPCEIDLFQYLIHLLNSTNPAAHYMNLSDLITNFHNSNSNSNSNNARPLLQ